MNISKVTLFTVDCENNDVRIVGSSAREGRVQFCYGELWGSICVYNTTWNDANADVVCRSLELGTGAYVQ